MNRRTTHEDSLCGVARPLDAIGDWWSLLIVRDAFDGLRRFGEFQKNLGLAKNMPRVCATWSRTGSWTSCRPRTAARITNTC